MNIRIFFLTVLSYFASQVSCQASTSSSSAPSYAINSDTQIPFYGFGSNLEMPTKSHVDAAKNWGFKMFRTQIGPDWKCMTYDCTQQSTSNKRCPPLKQPQSAYNDYVASNFDMDCPNGSKCHTEYLQEVKNLKNSGLAFVLLQKYLPLPFVTYRDNVGTLDGDLMHELVKFHMGILAYFKKTTGFLPTYVEPHYQPDSDQDCKMTPQQYDIFIQLIHDGCVLNSYGAELIGLGLSQADSLINAPYLDALSSLSNSYIQKWGVHAYDSSSYWQSGVNDFTSLIAKKDASKALFVTEYGSKDDGSKNSADYANSLIADTFYLLSKKTGALIPFEHALQGPLVWGKPKSTPASNLFQALLPFYQLANACHLDGLLSNVEGLIAAPIKGTLNGTESIVIAYWNSGAKAANFRQSITFDNNKWKYQKGIKLDGKNSHNLSGFFGIDIFSMPPSTGCVFLYQ